MSDSPWNIWRWLLRGGSVDNPVQALAEPVGRASGHSVAAGEAKCDTAPLYLTKDLRIRCHSPATPPGRRGSYAQRHCQLRGGG